MKTQIQYTKDDGEHGIALIHGPVSRLDQAKQELANQLNLPDESSPDNPAELDARLRNGGIDPSSIIFDQISE